MLADGVVFHQLRGIVVWRTRDNTDRIRDEFDGDHRWNGAVSFPLIAREMGVH